MKKIFSLILLTFVFSFVAGCTNQSDEQKEKPVEVSLENIVSGIKEQIAEDLKAQGAGEDVYVDGKLQSYIETDLKVTDESNPSGAIYLEKLKLNQEELENGTVIAAMMNVKSDEIIVLEASDEKHVASLKEALEREKEAQMKTWEVYLPDQFEKVKKNIIKTNGKFLLYATYENPEKIEKIFDKSFE